VLPLDVRRNLLRENDLSCSFTPKSPAFSNRTLSEFLKLLPLFAPLFRPPPSPVMYTSCPKLISANIIHFIMRVNKHDWIVVFLSNHYFMLIQNYIGLNKVLSQTCFIIYDCSFNWKTAI